jgi:hypothetical protein
MCVQNYCVLDSIFWAAIKVVKLYLWFWKFSELGHFIIFLIYLGLGWEINDPFFVKIFIDEGIDQ